MKALPVDGTDGSDTSAAPLPSVQTQQTPSTLQPSTPAPTITPVASPSTTPFTPYQSSDPDGSIRIAPSVTGDAAAALAAQLQLAEGYYAGKQSESAVTEYEKFLAMSSINTPGREKALYHLAESQRLMGSSMAAESTLQRLLQENPNGPFKAAAEFRLGELNEADGTLLLAADAFSQSALAATDPAIKQAANFREALCREKGGQKDQATRIFQTLARSTGENAYRIPAQLHLADSEVASGSKDQALDWYREILSSKPHGNTFGEAAVKSALILADLGKIEEARKLFESVAATKDAGAWQSAAALGALRLAASSNDQTEVLKLASTALSGDPENKPEILLLQANASRKVGKNSQALAIYDTIIKEYPGSKASTIAPFQRLLVLHDTHADSLLTEIDQYLLTASDPSDRSRAQLLKAEETLRRGQFKDAAALYHQIDTSALPPSSKTDILYKEAWALIQAGDKEDAAEALATFIKAYPNDEKAPAALAQLALLKQQQKDVAGALADFSQLELHYPKAPERELALQQKALLLGQQQDDTGMVEAFRLLLHDYPNSTAKAQAHYWIGWTALSNKDYPTAVLELSQARAADPKQFGERAGLRILLADYYLNKPDDAEREASTLSPSSIPPEVGRWLGLKAMESGNAPKAEKFLAPLVRDGLPGSSDPEIQKTLATALISEGKFRDAQAPAAACLKLSNDPASRAQALLLGASIQRSMKNLPQASSMIDEAMLLQPEGPINAEARILAGDLFIARQDFANAAKAYVTVAVLSDDPSLAPKALAKAVDAYRRAGDLTEAEKSLEELKKRFPDAPLPPMPKS